MSFSPCYPEPYPWGTAVVPRSAEGIYRPLYQALDVVSPHRIYPATIAQCAGYIQKGDHWDAKLFDAVMTYINAGFQWSQFVSTNIRLWDKFINAYNALHAIGYISFPYYWDVFWTRFFDPALNRPFWVQSRIQAPNTSRRLDTGATYPFNAAPWTNSPLIFYSISISNGSAFGDVWDNPV